MISQDSYQYIQIGLALRLLRNISNDDTVKLALDAISTLKNQLSNSNFSVSIAATQSTAFVKMEADLSGLTKTDKITDSLSKSISGQFTTLEVVVFAEACTKKIYVLQDRRFNTEYLLSQPEKLLKDGSFNKLEEIAKTDIASACRCILFGEATAAAFHILRATESVLKSYYFHHRKQKRLEKPMWGNMLDQLKAKTKNKPPLSLLQSLDLIRSAYRNPTQHPEAIYQIDSAQDLFGVCLDAIGKMAEEI